MSDNSKPKSSAQIKDELFRELVLIVIRMATIHDARRLQDKLAELNEATRREEYERYDV